METSIAAIAAGILGFWAYFYCSLQPKTFSACSKVDLIRATLVFPTSFVATILARPYVMATPTFDWEYLLIANILLLLVIAICTSERDSDFAYWAEIDSIQEEFSWEESSLGEYTQEELSGA